MSKSEAFEDHLSAEGRAALDKIAASCKMSRAEVVDLLFAETEQRLAVLASGMVAEVKQ